MKLQHLHMPVAYGGHVNSHGICIWRSHHSHIHAAAQCAVAAMIVFSPNLARYGCAMQHAFASHIHSCILRLHAPSSCMGRGSRGHAAALCSQMSGSIVDVAVLLHAQCCARGFEMARVVAYFIETRPAPTVKSVIMQITHNAPRLDAATLPIMHHRRHATAPVTALHPTNVNNRHPTSPTTQQ
jgi:hypothetical protein